MYTRKKYSKECREQLFIFQYFDAWLCWSCNSFHRYILSGQGIRLEYTGQKHYILLYQNTLYFQSLIMSLALHASLVRDLCLLLVPSWYIWYKVTHNSLVCCMLDRLVFLALCFYQVVPIITLSFIYVGNQILKVKKIA